MSKKRIHELAKEYGMTGKDLAGKLRDLGFTHVRSHMTALDEFEELSVQGVLEAHGYSRNDATGSVESDLGAGVIRRKKKKKAGSEDATDAAEAVTAVSPETVVPAAPAAAATPEATAPAAPSAEQAPAAAAEPVAEVEAPVEPPAVAAQPVAATSAPEVVEAPPAAPVESAAPAVEAEATPVPEAVAEVEAPSEPVPAVEPPTAEAPVEETPVAQAPVAQAPVEAAPVEQAPVAQTPAAEEAAPSPAAEAKAESASTTGETPSAAAPADKPATEAGQASSEKAPAKPADEPKTKAPAKKAGGPAGKVVGFIDLSKIQAAPKKSESRRLRSRDDVMPDVRPTLRHDSRNNMLRGDRGSRNTLTAAQLREREAGRYKRHARGGGRGGRGDRGRGRPSFDGSPYSGQTIRIEKPVTVRKLAESLAIKGNQLLKTAFAQLGFGAVQITTTLDDDTAMLLAQEFDVTLEFTQQIEAEEAMIEGLRAKRAAVDEGDLIRRNPTVAFLGHVDHGKTTLIDKIRDSQVADGEHGGITQHIGAYRVTTDLGHHVTIIDTPGHAAFTGMRARGAKAVDVVVLVVAADSGVQPQTEEALAHAKAAGVPVVVALNKIDRPEANVQKTMEQLSTISVIPEDWGGDTAIMPVSGITGEGIQELLERIFLESEMLELACHPDGAASGVVLEAEVQQGRGIVAHLLVQDGTLERGNVILAGEGYGKVRSIHDDFGNIIEQAGPSVPVEVSGLSALPGIGEPFHVVTKLDEAKKVAEERSRKIRSSFMAERRKLDNASLLQQVAGPTVDQVNVIVRADVQGTVEVLKAAISDPIHTEVEARVLQAGVGAVTENDILLASTSNALVIAFNVAIGANARKAAEREGVEVRNFNVLYTVIDTVHAMMEGRLAPEVSEEVVGHTEIRRLFRSSKIGNIAGSYVLDGVIKRDSKIRLMRDDQVIYTGVLASLKREADDAKEVREGFECGLVMKNYNDVREGDILESYKIVETKRTLESPPLEH